MIKITTKTFYVVSYWSPFIKEIRTNYYYSLHTAEKELKYAKTIFKNGRLDKYEIE